MRNINIPKVIDHKLAKKIQTLYSLECNEKKFAEQFDLFICNSGFENRTSGSLNSIKNKLKVKKSIIFIYHPRESKLYVKNLKNLGLVKNLVNFVSKESSVMELDPTDPWRFRQTMQEICHKLKINSKSRVLIDITSFTRVFLYELTYALYKSGCSFFVLYTEPKEYTKILPTGVNEIIVSPSFVGKPRPNKLAFLLVFLGWEKGRTRDIFESYNSDDNMGVFGLAPIDKKHIEWQKESKKQNSDLINKMKSIEVCSTLDLRSIMKFLDNVYERKQKEFSKRKTKFYFAITGLGPKIQNLACSLFALKHKDIQLIYGTPAYWGSTKTLSPGESIESVGVGETYLYGPISKKLIRGKKF